MALPEGTIEETIETTDPAAAVADGMTIDERSSLAFKQLETGADPKEVNKGFNAPFKSDIEESEAGATDTPEEAPGPTDGKSKPESQAGDDQHRTDLAIARRSLLRDGWTEKNIDALDEETILEMGQKRSEAQAAIDRKFSESGKKPTDGDATEVSETDADDDELFSEVREYDDELGAKAEARYKDVVKERNDLRLEVARVRFQSVVEKARSEFPELGDQANLDRVIDKAKSLAASNAYSTAEEAFADACKICLGDEREQAAQRRLLDKNRSERDGQVDKTVDADPENTPMTEDEVQSYAYKLLNVHGMDPHEVNRRTAKIPRAD